MNADPRSSVSILIELSRCETHRSTNKQRSLITCQFRDNAAVFIGLTYVFPLDNVPTSLHDIFITELLKTKMCTVLIRSATQRREDWPKRQSENSPKSTKLVVVSTCTYGFFST